jgi:superfamily II DNA or RNA helicase
MVDYSYQSHSAKKILKDALNPRKEAAVLAATPGSGKTTISHIIISNYLKEYPNAKVLVLAHGQTLLKNQYLDSLKEPNVKIDFTFGEFAGNNNIQPQVQVGLPQAIHKYSHDKVDLLVVDECHEFYLKPMVQRILEKLKPKHQVLLTGSPSEFNRLIKEGKEYGITYISGDELVYKNVFSSVEMNVVKVDYRNNARESLIEMLNHARKDNKDLSKIMIAVRSINEANNVTYYLKSIGRKVALSTHKNDRCNIMVKEFKKGNYDTLVVVQRGVLGFSDNNITGLFDLKCSKDVDISNQLFARVLRKHPKNIQKFYYRCGQKNGEDFNNQVIMLHKIRSLMRSDMFKKYDGNNMKVNLF